MDHSERSERGPSLAWVLASTGVLALGLSTALFWHTWTSSPSTITGCTCGDPALFIWFLAWPAEAIRTGHSLFFSTALFHPYGVNLLANTSVLAWGVILAPITWLFGPIATYNVALLLAPVLTALSGAWFARRFVTHVAPAVVAGILFGFAPFVISALAVGHLMIATLAPVPIIAGLVDDLLFTPRGTPLRRGALLALALVVQFFLSTEVFTMIVIMGGIVVVTWLLIVAVQRTSELRRRLRRALPGIVVALGLSGLLLAWPAWFAVRGPRSFHGLIWAPEGRGFGGAIPSSFVVPDTHASRLITIVSGYSGTPPVQETYVSIALLVVCAVGLIVRWRDVRMRSMAGIAMLGLALSLGGTKLAWAPWFMFDRFGPLGNVVESRFVLFALLALSVMLAMTIDVAACVHVSSNPRLQRPARVLLGTMVGAAAVSQLVAVTLPVVPFAVAKNSTPRWWRVDAPHLGARAVVLSYPLAFSLIQTPMTWQAEAGVGFSMVGGGGPQGLIHRAGPYAPGMRILAELSGFFTPQPTGTAAEIAQVRRTIQGLGVTTISVPVRNGHLVGTDGIDSRYAGAFMTAVIGAQPVVESGSWVWHLGRTLPPPLPSDPNLLSACTTAPAVPRVATPACVIGGGLPWVAGLGGAP